MHNLPTRWMLQGWQPQPSRMLPQNRGENRLRFDCSLCTLITCCQSCPWNAPPLSIYSSWVRFAVSSTALTAAAKLVSRDGRV